MAQWKEVAVSTVTVAALVSGCSDNFRTIESDGSGPTTTTAPRTAMTGYCTPEAIETWRPVPAYYNPNELARRIGVGVTASQVEHGLMGQADCNPSPSREQLTGVAPAISYTVEGIGERCLAIALRNTPGPMRSQPGLNVPKLNLICPAAE